VRREPHENVATVLVEPAALPDLELEMMGLDLHVWPVRTAPIVVDGERMAFQVRRRLLMAKRGRWDEASEWTPVWITFGTTWRRGDEPLPWAAHEALWDALAEFAEHVRYQKRLGGLRPLTLPEGLAL
jgi:hypothetical protein